MRRLRYTLALLVQFSWGIVQTLVGACVAFVVLLQGGKIQQFRSAWVFTWKLRRGLSLGPFIFLPERTSMRLIVHEYGHCMQSLIFGPLYLPLFALPSMVWAGIPRFSRMRKIQKKSYYSLYTERLANWLGERVTGDESPGQSLID